jgi:hypothetical protein
VFENIFRFVVQERKKISFMEKREGRIYLYRKRNSHAPTQTDDGENKPQKERGKKNLNRKGHTRHRIYKAGKPLRI